MGFFSLGRKREKNIPEHVQNMQEILVETEILKKFLQFEPALSARAVGPSPDGSVQHAWLCGASTALTAPNGRSRVQFPPLSGLKEGLAEAEGDSNLSRAVQ